VLKFSIEGGIKQFSFLYGKPLGFLNAIFKMPFKEHPDVNASPISGRRFFECREKKLQLWPFCGRWRL